MRILLLAARTIVCTASAALSSTGKSTYLRSAAQLAVLAQIGSFVPAAYARISIVDRLFARVGASDDVTRSRSTFMLEMEETAAILRLVTSRSLVLIDEVGRGTAMADGLALAAAIAEHLTSVGCRVLFATHIHELTALALAPRLAGEPRVRCMAMDVLPGDVPVLTHKVVLHPVHALGQAARDLLTNRISSDPTAASAEASASLHAWKRVLGLSHGLHVATVAGMPTSVISRARRILDKLDETHAAAAWALAVAQVTTMR
jgi:DNA mismatch repair protein MutS